MWDALMVQRHVRAYFVLNAAASLYSGNIGHRGALLLPVLHTPGAAGKAVFLPLLQD